MKAIVENNTIKDIAHTDPFEIFTPAVAALYDTEVPETAKVGDELINGEWVTPEVEELIPVERDPAEIFEFEKNNKINEINATFEEEIAVIKTGYVEDEIKSWPQQIAEAQAYQADNTAVTPLLDAMVAQRGGTKDELVLRIATNATQYAQVFGAALGKKQKAIADLG
jgi:hypothetical protein